MVKIKNINQAIDEDLDFQKRIRDGTLTPRKTGIYSIDNYMLDGLYTPDIVTLAGLSGTGKTALMNQIIFNAVTLNKNVRALCFTFETPARKLISRKVSSMSTQTLKTLYSKNHKVETQYYNKLRGLPIDYVEIPANAEIMADTMYKYANSYIEDDIIFFVDHTLLLDSFKGDSDIQTVIAFCKGINMIKTSIKGMYIILTQLNDKILDHRRLAVVSKQYPEQGDIFGSKYIYHLSDYVSALVNPSKLNLPGSNYGNHKLPFTDKDNRGKRFELIYNHRLKCRMGQPGIDVFASNLKYNALVEFGEERRRKFKEKYKL